MKPFVRTSFLGTRPSCLPSPGGPFFAQATENRINNWAALKGGRRPVKSSTPRRLVWDTNMAAVSVFWDTNMAAVTSCENTPNFVSK